MNKKQIEIVMSKVRAVFNKTDLNYVVVTRNKEGMISIGSDRCRVASTLLMMEAVESRLEMPEVVEGIEDIMMKEENSKYSC